MSQRLVATEQNFAALSRDYKQKASEVREVQQFLNRELKNSVWEGKAATSFRADWERYDKVLNELHELFNGLSKDLKGREGWTREFETRKNKG